MRELPEPDSYTWGASEPNVFTPVRVKDIQRQAYEDGLRDAASNARNLLSGGRSHLGPVVESSILTLLTASQKEAK